MPKSIAVLPGTKPKLVMPFKVGAKVQLRGCPGPPGTVRGITRGKVRVDWGDLDYVGKHRAEALVLIDQEEK